MHKVKDCCSVRLVRLNIGERIQVGDYCFDARAIIKSGKEIYQSPIQIVQTDERSIISKYHHPHFRIIKSFLRGRASERKGFSG